MSRLAVDIGGTYLRYEMIGKKECCGKLSSREIGLTAFIEKMKKAFPDLEAVAVSFAGQVHEGVILSAPNIVVDEPEIETWALERLGLRLTIENDLNCAALAESIYWESENLVALYSGTGLGAGIVEKGAICHGARNLVGEIGHVPYREAPFVCGCGKRNCLELYASGSGIEKWLRHVGCGAPADLARLRGSDEEPCRKIAEAYEEALVHAAATLVTLCNPELLVLGGGIVRHNPRLVDTIGERLPRYALSASLQRLRIERSHIENASLEGAKALLADL